LKTSKKGTVKNSVKSKPVNLGDLEKINAEEVVFNFFCILFGDFLGVCVFTVRFSLHTSIISRFWAFGDAL